MYHWGKTLGILFAIFSSNGFLGTILSFLIGYLIDKILDIYLNKIDFLYIKEIKNDVFIRTTFQVMGHISKSKGRVTIEDIHNASILMTHMKLNDELIQFSKKSFIEGKLQNFPLRSCLRRFYNKYYKNYELIKKFLIIQIQTALLDDCLHHKEKKILSIISEELYIGQQEFYYIFSLVKNTYKNSREEKYNYKFNQFYKDNKKYKLKYAYKTLGVHMNDDNQTIKRAYIRLMKENHPDKLMSRGVSPEIIEQAKKKTQDIQKSYDLIKKERISHQI